ncbi:catechol 2,3-dioxygenase-like lactoylglutathione lyase family enzyme [Sinorhizobium fredii]|uniref:Glyoxalase/bleomycin resistance protein/dioxygenase n=1 Tax=Sinorhizobium fredii (strain USDA 257) TaxID=1185652 RepID=I3X4L9_SINF2|nr:VOC family protein [Sinorhizobium fredii]AFL50825.1 glyoxalase/bleomycin resistance protein/dioxygenase [Sinorhizobium fredii USDA 257]
MKFVNPLPFVADISRSKSFYSEVLQLQILEDHGNFVQFDNGFALHDGASLYQTVFGESRDESGPYGRRNLVLYFEDEDIDTAFKRIADRVDLIHEVRQQSWGQRVFRFFDPDGHIVEIGEPQVTTSVSKPYEP